MVWHDCETVELKAAFVAMLEKGGYEEFGVGCALEVAVLLKCRDRDGVRALLLSDCSHNEKNTPGAKAPFVQCC